jgi:hypothetical protein
MRIASCALLTATLALSASTRPSAAEPVRTIAVQRPTTVFTQAPERPLPTTSFNNPKVQLRPVPAPRPVVVCGMTLIPPGPNIDPKIGVKPSTRGVKPLIRTIPPRECQAPETPATPNQVR